jgi:hypothetical protein
MRMFVLSRAGRKLEDGTFFFGTRGIFDSFQNAAQTAMGLWKLDERTMREYADRVFFIISEHRVQKSQAKINDNNRCAPLRRWYWVPTEDAFFYPYEADGAGEN